MKKCAHTEHCCKKHGCKYSKDDCPVVSGEKLQSYPCEDCCEDNHNSGFDVPRVGTGLIVVKDKKVLVGIRKGSHAAGLFSFPGGHLDWGESWRQCVLRELKEECGEQIKVEIRPLNTNHEEFFVTNDIMPQYNKHYITIFMVADWISGNPINAEPHKCKGWVWIDFDQLKVHSDQNKTANWLPIHLISEYREQIGI